MGQQVTGLLSFAIVAPWNGVVLDRVPSGKEKKMLYALICSNSLIIQVTPLRSSLTGNSKGVVVHLAETSAGDAECLESPEDTRRKLEVTELGVPEETL